MDNTKQGILETLELALQTEERGRAFYLEAARKNSNELGRQILQTLADQEVNHFNKIKEIYDFFRQKEEWPEGATLLRHKAELKTVFDGVVKTLGTGFVATSSDIEALQFAKGLEDKTYNLYHTRSQQATGAEKHFYEALAAEEREHFLIVDDTLEYLTDPQGWFVKKERHSLDGG